MNSFPEIQMIYQNRNLLENSKKDFINSISNNFNLLLIDAQNNYIKTRVHIFY